jgi:exopolysaccharide biosynthesis WecB/TagA/CpsF family protein
MPALATRRSILDLDVIDLGWDEALDFAAATLKPDGEQTIIAFLNANNANIAMRDRDYFSTMQRLVILPDGMGVDIAAKAIHGKPFTANLNGTDFVPALLTYLKMPKRIGLLGARADVFAKTIEAFARHAPWHDFIGISDGFFDRGRSDVILDRIEAEQLDILLVAMGSPAQEKWIGEHIKPHHGKLVIGVGALFDFVSGTVPRAPQRIRSMRLEWLFRLWIEPARLWRRYVLGNPVFLFHVLRYRLRRRGGS